MCTTPTWTTRFSFFLKVFFFAVFAGAFAILCLCRGLLLVGYRAAARALAGARVGVCALAPHRQTAAMPQAPVRSHLDVPLDIEGDFLPQVALDRALVFQNLTDPVDLVFRQIADLLVLVDAGPM